MTDTTHALYRFWDTTGQLLYVGITSNPGQRWKAHQDDKPWWHAVANITIETHPDRHAVLAAERAAIIAEKPLHNVVYNRGTKAAPEPTPVLDRLQPFQVGDWVALCLPGGRCPVGEIAAMDETWVSIRLKSFLSGGLMNRVEVIRWADIQRAEAAYPEHAEPSRVAGLVVMDDEHLGTLQTAWRNQHHGADGGREPVDQARIDAQRGAQNPRSEGASK